METKNLTVLWISEKNGNGICIDQKGNEYYIDRSIKGFDKLKIKDKIDGTVERITGTLCVREVL